MSRVDWGPDGLITDVPNIARMYDYYLGGKHNFPADRRVAERVIEAYPPLPEVLKRNRAFLRRAVIYMVEHGIRQFLDIGSGLPTEGNVHEIAQGIAPDCRIVYVDKDQVAVTMSRAMLVDNPLTSVVCADFRQPERILGHRDLRAVLDLDQPVGVLVVALLHFILDQDYPEGIIGEIHEALAPGSYLAVTHASPDFAPEEAARVAALYERSGHPMAFRPREDVAQLFDAFKLVEPGLVRMEHWRPDPDEIVSVDPISSGYAGVGIKI